MFRSSILLAAGFAGLVSLGDPSGTVRPGEIVDLPHPFAPGGLRHAHDDATPGWDIPPAGALSGPTLQPRDVPSYDGGSGALRYRATWRKSVLMSAPFAGPPLPAETASATPDIHAALAALPRPRKHYQWYYSTRAANEEMWHPKQGLGKFLRAYFHMKSSDWRLPDGTPANRPHRLAGWTSEALAEMPTYYIMDAAEGMAATVAPHMPSAEHEAACTWLSPRDLSIYAEEYGRTGFQGGLHWYRGQTSGKFAAEMSLFHGRRIAVPAIFIAGEADWGIFQFPGALEAMREKAFARMQAVHVVPGAGHWAQQEQPQAVVRLVLDFLRHLPRS